MCVNTLRFPVLYARCVFVVRNLGYRMWFVLRLIEVRRVHTQSVIASEVVMCHWVSHAPGIRCAFHLSSTAPLIHRPCVVDALLRADKRVACAQNTSQVHTIHRARSNVAPMGNAKRHEVDPVSKVKQRRVHLAPSEAQVGYTSVFMQFKRVEQFSGMLHKPRAKTRVSGQSLAKLVFQRILGRPQLTFNSLESSVRETIGLWYMCRRVLRHVVGAGPSVMVVAAFCFSGRRPWPYFSTRIWQPKMSKKITHLLVAHSSRSTPLLGTAMTTYRRGADISANT